MNKNQFFKDIERRIKYGRRLLKREYLQTYNFCIKEDDVIKKWFNIICYDTAYIPALYKYTGSESIKLVPLIPIKYDRFQ